MACFRDEDVRMALNICAARAGYSLRPLQEQVISFVQGSDVFVEVSLLQHSSRRFELAAESKVVHCRYSKSPDERPGMGTPHFMRLCLRAHAIEWCENSIAHFKNLARPFFLPRACVEKTG